MVDQVFSERHGFAPKPQAQANDHLPPWVREAIINDVRDFISNKPSSLFPSLDFYQLLRPYMWQVLGREPPGNPMGGPWAMYIPRTLTQAPWWQFYDILEQLARLVAKQWGGEYLDSLAQAVNVTLAREGISWKMENGQVIHAFHPQIQQQIAEAGALLADPRFRGADEQFGKAIECLSRRPDPDEENCVKDAVGAMEAVANILAGTTGVQLNRLLDQEPYRAGVPTAIRISIEKLYAYRGATPGVAHGQVGQSVVGIEEARWVLAISAATILYFVSKFSRDHWLNQLSKSDEMDDLLREGIVLSAPGFVLTKESVLSQGGRLRLSDIVSVFVRDNKRGESISAG
ncbi:MAG: hypothetical protein HYX92_09005 [Chloroflexi bacterium]|nr:hypothetical protein [Chloroflexota bacterium]